jgi:glycosyltransferase 2 family protein
MSNYKTIRLAAWIIALTLAIWLLRDLPFKDILDSVSNLSMLQWIYWATLNLLIIFVFVWRWMALTKGLDLNLNFLKLLCLRQAGQSVSFITPGPQFGGEPLQIYLLWKKFQISPGDSFLAIALDRFFELWVNFAVLLLGILFLAFSGSGLANWISVALIIAFAMLLLCCLAWYVIKRNASIVKLISTIGLKWLGSKRLSNINFHWNQITNSLQKLLSKKITLLVALLLSISGWLLTFVELYLVLSFFNIYLSTSDFILLLVAMRLAFLLPLPGGIGTLEASVLWVFGAIALPETAAASLLALIRFRDIIVLSLGLIFLRLLQSKAVTV